MCIGCKIGCWYRPFLDYIHPAWFTVFHPFTQKYYFVHFISFLLSCCSIICIFRPMHRDCSSACKCNGTYLLKQLTFRHSNKPEPSTEIIGAPDMYIETGSTINLTCVIENSPEPPAYIFWNHNNAVSILDFFEYLFLFTFISTQFGICQLPVATAILDPKTVSQFRAANSIFRYFCYSFSNNTQLKIIITAGNSATQMPFHNFEISITGLIECHQHKKNGSRESDRLDWKFNLTPHSFSF